MKALANGEASIYISGEITSQANEENSEMSAPLFKKELDALGDVSTIHLYVNSPGGSVPEGIAISNMLKRHKAYVIGHVDGIAASIASNIIASCDEVRMPENTMLFIHNAWTYVTGNAEAIRKAADDIEHINEVQIQTYMAKIGNKTTEAHIRELLDAETWLSAREAYEIGLCDVVEGEMRAVAKKDYQEMVVTWEERKNIIADCAASIKRVGDMLKRI